MSRQVSSTELARIVATLLIHPESLAELDSPNKFSGFMTHIAKVVADYCGGEITGPADSGHVFTEGTGEEVWLVGVRVNDCLPHPVNNVWALADPDGVEDYETFDGEAVQAAAQAEAACVHFTYPT